MKEQDNYGFEDRIKDRVILFWDFIARKRYSLPATVRVEGIIIPNFNSYSAERAANRLTHYLYEKRMAPFRKKWEEEESYYTAREQ